MARRAMRGLAPVQELPQEPHRTSIEELFARFASSSGGVDRARGAGEAPSRWPQRAHGGVPVHSLENEIFSVQVRALMPLIPTLLWGHCLHAVGEKRRPS